ncbi:MAG: hypothetical protein GC182_00855 [Rhodopseudomonas sp.]|nr:hypothetical protein [Rhodopseudomonas sp.]
MRFGLLFATALAALTIFSQNAQAATHIYLLKGLANVFSTGLDTLSDELAKRGYRPEVHNHIEYEELADKAAKAQKADKGAIIIIGHSLGADAAVSMAELLKTKGAKVALLVTFGPDDGRVAPTNVAHILNFNFGEHNITKGPGFRGTIKNVNLIGHDGINHFNVEKIERLHATVIAEIQRISRAPRPAPAQRPMPSHQSSASNAK